MRFFADEMLGKLSRWLRMCGVDVVYLRQIDDDTLVAQAKAEELMILTRDTHLLRRLSPPAYLFIRHDLLEDQFREFLARFPDCVDLKQSLSRCVECNTPLQPIAKERVQGLVWPYVFATQEQFTHCPACRRIYWKATHVRKIQEKLRRLMGIPEPTSPKISITR